MKCGSVPSFLCFLRGAKLWFVAFPLANMSAHKCGKNPFTGVLIKKPMNLLPRIKMSGRKGFRRLVCWGARGNASVPLATLKPEHLSQEKPNTPTSCVHLTTWIARRGLMHYLQRYRAISIWASHPEPTASLARHPGGPLPSHSPQTKHVKLIPRLEFVPGSHRQVSSPAAAPESGRRRISQEGRVGLPVGWEGDATQLGQTVRHSRSEDTG